MPLDTSIKKVLVIGSGPIVIGQAAEFDYAGAHNLFSKYLRYSNNISSFCLS